MNIIYYFEYFSNDNFRFEYFSNNNFRLKKVLNYFKYFIANTSN